MKRTMLMLTLFALALSLFSACSEDPTSAAKRIVAEKIAKDSQGYFKLHSFKKDDGVKNTIDGEDFYDIQYTIEVECLKDGGWAEIYRRDGKLYLNRNFIVTVENFSGDAMNMVSGKHFAQTKAGDIYLDHGNMRLAKHEDGWVEGDK